MLRKLTSSTATGGGLTEPLTLSQQLTTSATGIAFQPAGPTLTNTGTTILASGPFTVGGALTFGSGGPTLSNSGTTISSSGPFTAGGLVTAASGVNFGTAGTLSNGGTNTISTAGALQAGQISSTFTPARFWGVNTQTTAASAALGLKGYASNQASQMGIDIGIGTTWSGLASQVLVRFAHSMDGTPVYPLKIGATGKLNFYNSASNAADVVGTATLTTGSVTVATTAVETGDKIFLTHAGTGTSANFGVLYQGAIVNGTSFVISSTNASDNDTVNWWIIKKG